MLSRLIKNLWHKLRPLQHKKMKDAKKELVQDLARADDDGFAVTTKKHS